MDSKHLIWLIVGGFAAVGCVLGLAFTVMGSIVALFAKGNFRKYLTTALLIIATNTILLAIILPYIPRPYESEPKDYTSKPVDQGLSLDRQIEMMGISLQQEEGQNSFSGLRKMILTLVDGESQTREQCLSAVAGELWKLSRSKYCAEPNLHAAMLLVQLESKNPDPKVTKFLEKQKSSNSDWYSALKKIYAGEKVSADELTLFSNRNLFPSRWFRNQIYLRAASNQGPSPQSTAAENDRQQHISNWTTRILSLFILQESLFFIGLIAIKLLWSEKSDFEARWMAQPWSFKEVWGSFLFFYYSSAFCGILLLAYPRTEVNANSREVLSLCVSEFFLAIVACVFVQLVLFRPAKTDFFSGCHIFWPNSEQWKKIAFNCFCFFASCVVLNHVTYWLTRLLTGKEIVVGNPVKGDIVEAVYSHEVVLMVLAFLAVAVVGPIFEEIMFRGILFSWLRTRSGFWLAAIISAALFAIWHADLGAFWLYFGMGVMTALFFERSKNLIAPIALHVIWNTFSVAEKVLLYF